MSKLDAMEMYERIFGERAPGWDMPSVAYERMMRGRIDEWLDRTTFEAFCKEIEKQVIGQKALTIVLANVYSYLNSIVNGTPICNNMLLSAPSGCGKTETYRALKDYFHYEIPDLDVYIYDVSNITATGFKGQDPSMIVRPFAEREIENPYGIVFLDEFDKKIMPVHANTGENINAEVQANLLTLIEGGEVYCRHFPVDTHGLMFVGLGSFEQFRNKKGEVKRPIGIGTEFEEETDIHYKPLTRDDMIDAGASNELIGRFPYIVNYEKLADEAILRVIQKTIGETQQEFNFDSLIVDKPMIQTLKESANSKYGCRLIKSTLKEFALQGYAEALLHKDGDQTLSMKIVDKDDVQYTWTDMSDEEVKQLNARRKRRKEADEVLRAHEAAAEALDSVWDDNKAGIMV